VGSPETFEFSPVRDTFSLSLSERKWAGVRVFSMATEGDMTSHASQSSNSGCDGDSQRVPKSSGDSTRPVPK
jgi:hypothetical protein